MLKHKHTIVIYFFVLSLPVFSQIVSGYQGKRNIISYQDNMSLSFYEPTYLNRTLNNSRYSKTEESLLIPVNNTHCITYERVVKRNFSLGVGYALAATKTYVDLVGYFNDPNTSERIEYQFENVKTNVFAHYFTGSLIFYGKKTLAPLGSYFKMNLGYCVIKSKLLPDKEFKTEPTSQIVPSNIYTLGTQEGYFGMNRVTCGFTFGSHRIYGGRWVVNRGLNLNFLFKGADDSSLYTNAYTKVQTRVIRHDVFTFFLGLGYLL